MGVAKLGAVENKALGGGGVTLLNIALLKLKVWTVGRWCCRNLIDINAHFGLGVPCKKPNAFENKM